MSTRHPTKKLETPIDTPTTRGPIHHLRISKGVMQFAHFRDNPI